MTRAMAQIALSSNASCSTMASDLEALRAVRDAQREARRQATARDRRAEGRITSRRQPTSRQRAAQRELAAYNERARREAQEAANEQADSEELIEYEPETDVDRPEPSAEENKLYSALVSCNRPTLEELNGIRDCHICQQPFDPEPPLYLPCGHVIGQTCLVHWWKERDPECRCPVCRQAVETAERLAKPSIEAEDVPTESTGAGSQSTAPLGDAENQMVDQEVGSNERYPAKPKPSGIAKPPSKPPSKLFQPTSRLRTARDIRPSGTFSSYKPGRIVKRSLMDRFWPWPR